MIDFNARPEAGKAAMSAIRALQDLARIATPQAIAQVAAQHYPGVPLQMAIAKLEIEITQARTEFAAYAAQCKEVHDAERERLAPVRGSAVRRTFAIHEQLEQIGREIAHAQSETESRRKKMSEAKMTQAEIDNLAPAVADTSVLLAERERLTVELNSLNAFISTNDESLLPDGFELTEPLKISFPVDKLLS